MNDIDESRFSRQQQARRTLWRRLTPAERVDRAMQYALFWLLADEPIKLLRDERLAVELFQRLQNEYRAVVAPGRRAAGLPEWSPPPGFFPATRPPRPAATRAKIRASQRGRIFSAEHRRRISAALRGHRTCVRTRAAVSAANRRRAWSAESRAKISASLRARRHTTATKQRMSNSALKRMRDARGRFS